MRRPNKKVDIFVNGVPLILSQMRILDGYGVILQILLKSISAKNTEVSLLFLATYPADMLLLLLVMCYLVHEMDTIHQTTRSENASLQNNTPGFVTLCVCSRDSF